MHSPVLMVTVLALGLSLVACGEKKALEAPVPETMNQFNSPLLGKEAPLLEQADIKTVGAALAASDVKADGFTTDGYYPDVGAPPLTGDAYGSQSSGDGVQGTLSYTVAVPAGSAAIAIPIVTGPSGSNASFKVLNADGSVVAALNEAPGLGVWRIWRVPAPEGATSLQVVATDAGAGWGEWVGVGTAHVAR